MTTFIFILASYILSGILAAIPTIAKRFIDHEIVPFREWLRATLTTGTTFVASTLSAFFVANHLETNFGMFLATLVFFGIMALSLFVCDRVSKRIREFRVSRIAE